MHAPAGAVAGGWEGVTQGAAGSKEPGKVRSPVKSNRVSFYTLLL